MNLKRVGACQTTALYLPFQDENFSLRLIFCFQIVAWEWKKFCLIRVSESVSSVHPRVPTH